MVPAGSRDGAGAVGGRGATGTVVAAAYASPEVPAGSRDDAGAIDTRGATATEASTADASTVVPAGSRDGAGAVGGRGATGTVVAAAYASPEVPAGSRDDAGAIDTRGATATEASTADASTVVPAGSRDGAGAVGGCGATGTADATGTVVAAADAGPKQPAGSLDGAGAVGGRGAAVADAAADAGPVVPAGGGDACGASRDQGGPGVLDAGGVGHGGGVRGQQATVARVLGVMDSEGFACTDDDVSYRKVLTGQIKSHITGNIQLGAGGGDICGKDDGGTIGTTTERPHHLGDVRGVGGSCRRGWLDKARNDREARGEERQGGDMAAQARTERKVERHRESSNCQSGEMGRTIPPPRTSCRLFTKERNPARRRSPTAGKMENLGL